MEPVRQVVVAAAAAAAAVLAAILDPVVILGMAGLPRS